MAKRIPLVTIKFIKKLRSRGWSLPEIHKKVEVGYGSVFRHIQGVDILPQYQSLWYDKRGGSKKRKRKAELEAKQRANRVVSSLSEKELFIIFACLYWAEGNKKDFSFTNTDPEMVKVFVKCIETMGISKERLRVTIRTYEDLDKKTCIKYWAEIINIPVEQIINVNVIKGKKKGKLAHGMCRIRLIKGGDMLKYAVALKDRVAELLI